MAGGASILLSVIPEGSQVKRGDVLAVLDSSDYEELLRTQRISVERAKADLVQAQLDHEVAELAVREFKEGVMRETITEFEGRLFLARSELERANDRLNWCLRMKEKGYVAASTVSAEAYRKAQLALNLAREDSAFELFKKFTAPRDDSRARRCGQRCRGHARISTIAAQAAHRTARESLESKSTIAPSALLTMGSSFTPITSIATS